MPQIQPHELYSVDMHQAVSREFLAHIQSTVDNMQYTKSLKSLMHFNTFIAYVWLFLKKAYIIKKIDMLLAVFCTISA